MKGFLSYSHQDMEWFKALAPHLKALKRAFDLDVWTDHQILAGTLWETRIERAIEEADVMVLLLSPDFIGSDYVWNVEMPAIRARRDKAGAVVLPVVLKRCKWTLATRQTQVVPIRNGSLTPLADWPRRDHALDAAREQMDLSIQAHFGLTAKEPAL